MKKIIRPIILGFFLISMVSCGKDETHTKTLYLINIKSNYDPCKKLVFYSKDPKGIEWAISELGIKSTDEIKIESSCQSTIKYSCEHINVSGAPGYDKLLKKGVNFKMSLLYKDLNLGVNFLSDLKNRCQNRYGGTFKEIY